MSKDERGAQADAPQVQLEKGCFLQGLFYKWSDCAECGDFFWREDSWVWLVAGWSL
jgi:uncharacterized protein with PIN domain